jgi:hypothetical protein
MVDEGSLSMTAATPLTLTGTNLLGLVKCHGVAVTVTSGNGASE